MAAVAGGDHGPCARVAKQLAELRRKQAAPFSGASVAAGGAAAATCPCVHMEPLSDAAITGYRASGHARAHDYQGSYWETQDAVKKLRGLACLAYGAVVSAGLAIARQSHVNPSSGAAPVGACNLAMQVGTLAAHDAEARANPWGAHNE